MGSVLSLALWISLVVVEAKLEYWRERERGKRDGSIAEASRSLQRNRGEDHGTSHCLRFQRERRSQRHRIRCRRWQPRLQVPYLVLVINSPPFSLLLLLNFNFNFIYFCFSCNFYWTILSFFLFMFEFLVWILYMALF